MTSHDPCQVPYGPPPRRRSWVRRHRKAVIISAAALFAGVIAIAAAAGNGAPPQAPFIPLATSPAAAGTFSAASVPPSAASTPAPASSAPPVITYVVTGGPADVTYGPDGSTLSGTAPMRVTRRLGNAMYYAINAQLQGSGTVSVKILINGTVISGGTASGSYNIASAEISQDPVSGQWEDAQSG